MDPVNTYTWTQFVTKVNEMLTIDADRYGVNTYKDAIIRQGVIDIQSFIPYYQQYHESLYYSCDFVLEGFASRGVKPPASRIHQLFHVTILSDTRCVRRFMDPYPWQDRFALVHGAVQLDESGPANIVLGGLNQWQAPGSPGYMTEGYFPNRYSLTSYGRVEINNRPKYAVDPQGYEFLVYPDITGCHLLSMFWTGVKINFNPLELTPFDEKMAMAVSFYVKAHLAREIDHDIGAFESYMKSYANERTTLYIDANARRH